jgi:hypothetical protein
MIDRDGSGAIVKYQATEGHPVVGSFCHGCGEEFETNDFLALVSIEGPGPDPNDRARARSGERFDPQKLAVCWACVTGEEKS